MIKFILLLALGLFLVGCSAPNNINISKQNLCVQPSMYAGGSATNSPYPAIANNPTQAPSCMAITLQNNNSGMNATNVQIVSSGGVNLSYSVNGNTISSMLYDPVASGITTPPSGYSQQVGDITLYDPNNCATPQGIKIITLNSGGGSCTFYLQAQNAAYAIGQYPMVLNYNYTNGNQNFVATVGITQSINLLAGGASGIYQVLNNAWAQAFSVVNLTNIVAITGDMYGNAYVVGNSSASGGNIWVYMFNSNPSLIPLPALNGQTATSLAVDNSGNLYIGTGSGVYTMNVRTPNSSWSKLSGITVGVSGIVYAIPNTTPPLSPVLYVTTTNGVYVCSLSNPPATLCNQYQGSNMPVGGFTQNALATDTLGNLYTGNTTSNGGNNYYQYPYQSGSVSLVTGSNTQNVTIDSLSSVNLASSSSGASAMFIFLGLWNNNPQVLAPSSMMLACTVGNGALCQSLGDNNVPNANVIQGNVLTTLVDGANNVYAIGDSLNIVGSSGASYYGMYLAVTNNNGSLAPSGSWAGVANGVLSSGASPLTTSGIFLWLQ